MMSSPQAVTQNRPTLDLRPLTAAQLEKARSILSAGRYLARQKAPYFSRMLLRLVVRETTPTPEFFTVAVTDSLIMLACMEYVHTLTPEQMAGDWLHECLHVMNRHGARRGARDHRMFNVAADLSINTIVKDMGVAQTPIAIWPKDFGFEEGLAAEAYYEMLKKSGKGGRGGKQGGQGQGQGSGGKGPASHAQPGGGHCGSCAGHAVDGEPASGSDPDEATSADVAVVVRETAEAIKAAHKSRGNVPAGLLLFADDALAPPKVPWQTQLQRAVRRACSYTAGAAVHRYDAPGRRQACVGYGIGRPIMPRLRMPVPRVAVMVDTSGSMGAGPGSPLAEALTETMGVVKAAGADVDFVACDAAVHAVTKVRNVRDLMAAVKGGGGTDFRPAFDAVARMRPRPDIAIMATDGYGPAPDAPPPGVHVVWLLIGQGAPMPAKFGDVIRID